MHSLCRRTALHHLVGAGVLLSGVPLAQAQTAGRRPTADPRVLVARATRLSVLTDRITRGHVQLTLNIQTQRAERTLTDSVAEVRRLLTELGDGLVGHPALPQYQTLAKQYNDFLTLTRLDMKNPLNLLTLSQRADTLGQTADALVVRLVNESELPQAQILAVTADLQRLTQHMAVHFLLVRTGQDEKTQQQLLLAGRQAFARQLAELQAFPLKTPQITQDLALLNNQWTLMNQALDLQSRDSSAMEKVCTTSELTLEVLTQLYPAFEGVLKSAMPF